MPSPRRVQRCTNERCGQFGTEVTVHAREYGPFWEWPALRCGCGCEPMVIPPLVLDLDQFTPPGELDAAIRDRCPDGGYRLELTD